MGTVGLSFGAATSGTGFDVSSTVSAIMAESSAIETPWNNQLTALQSQDTALTSMGTDLSTLTTSLQSLTDADGVFSSMQGSSSDNSVVELTNASTGAVAGTHSVTVTRLAQTSSVYSGDAAASDNLSGSFTITIGSGTAQTVTVASGSTLSTLAAAINQGSYGVKANVITDSGGERLALVSSTGGAAGQIAIGGSITDSTSGGSLSFSSGQAGLDAEYNVDGIDMTSGSNTVTGAIPGVTMQLLGTSSNAAQLVIANDNSAVESAMSSFVTAYNAVVKDVNAQEQNSSSGSAQPLFGTPIMAQIQQALSNALIGGSASGSMSNIAQLGLEVSANGDGTLTLNTNTLDSALNSDYNGVEGFLQNTGSFGQNLASALNGLGNQAPDGAVYLTLQQNSSQETDLNNSITNENALLATEKTNLTAELTAANLTLQAIPEQIQSIQELYSAITGYGNTATS